MLEAVEIVYAGICVSYAGYSAQPQECFACEVIRCEDIMIHHREEHHGVQTSTLFHAHRATSMQTRVTFVLVSCLLSGWYANLMWISVWDQAENIECLDLDSSILLLYWKIMESPDLKTNHCDLHYLSYSWDKVVSK